jgi:hypothetical protein
MTAFFPGTDQLHVGSSQKPTCQNVLKPSLTLREKRYGQ